jgi:Uma2 family endonuclease
MGIAGARRATFADLEDRPEKPYAEVIGGVVVEKAVTGFSHSLVAMQLAGMLGPPFNRATSTPDAPGGWWLTVECTIELEPHEVYVPDLSGWRHERLPAPPEEYPVKLVPDWVCEILSPSNRRYDTVDKLRVYQRHGVGHYWLIDPDAATLTVLHNQPGGFVITQVACRGERIRAAPFAAVELAVGRLLGDEPDPP